MMKTKEKASKGEIRTPQRHIHSRISYLYQAATYLTKNSICQQMIQHISTDAIQTSAELNDAFRQSKAVHAHDFEHCEANGTIREEEVGIFERISSHPLSNTTGLPRHLLSHARAVSMKSQIRLSPTIKQSICKRCYVLLVPGSTSMVRMENRSRGGRKPWADVLVTTCNFCGTTKRFPVGAKRPPPQSQRPNGAGERVMQDQNSHTDVLGQAQVTAEELPEVTP